MVHGKADSRADWGQVRGLYEQMSTILGKPNGQAAVSEIPGPPELPDIISGPLALRFGRVFSAYAGIEEIFGNDLLEVMSEVDNLDGSDRDRFRQLYADLRFEQLPPYKASKTKRRRPRPFEAAIETCRRIRDINTLRRVISNGKVPTAGILGGSANYGRFYNVKGHPRLEATPSDLDILLVVPNAKEIPELCATLGSFWELDSGELEKLVARSRIHQTLVETDPQSGTLLSQKIPIWKSSPDAFMEQRGLESNYDISLHIASLDVFEKIILHSMSKIPDDRRTMILDYRADRPLRKMASRGFNGIDVLLTQQYTKVDSGFLSEVQVFDSYGQRFKPGMHQGLVMPEFDIRWDDQPLSLRAPIAHFKWKVLEKLRQERGQRPWEVQLLSLSHARFSIFAPHVKQQVDNLSIES
ncbi:hypothetical protein [Streptomyces sp. NBC_00005]|uniref:hypothetical protein n=1 Tax=Streptomyces sp. NBC_00005 TaxID=2903609 RepID=UPI00324CCC48